MDRYIGLDVHATTCTAAVIDAQGKKLPCKGGKASKAARTEEAFRLTSAGIGGDWVVKRVDSAAALEAAIGSEFGAWAAYSDRAAHEN